MRSATLLLFTLALAAFSCTRPQDESPQFNRLVLQQHIYVNQVLPAFDSAFQAASALNASVDSLVAHPDSGRVVEARQAWVRLALAFEYVSPFCFGPGNLAIVGNLRTYLNTFPTDAARLEREIASGQPPTTQGPRNLRGVPALDYLLFANNPTLTAALLAASPTRKSTLTICASGVVDGLAEARNGWNTQGAAFRADNSTSAGSAISELYNGFLEDFEVAKNYKLALPLGVMAGQTTAEPTRLEGYYSGISTELLKAQLAAINAIYTGESLNGKTGPGFDDYLTTVPSGNNLVAQTNAQYQAMLAALAALPAQPLSATITTQPSKAIALQQEVQKLTRYYKSDMSSLLGISITFSSADGD